MPASHYWATVGRPIGKNFAVGEGYRWSMFLMWYGTPVGRIKTYFSADQHVKNNNNKKNKQQQQNNKSADCRS